MSASLDLVLRHYGSLSEVEHRFTLLTNCTACSRLLSRELVYRRCYELSGACTALTILCQSCNDALPLGSIAERQFKAGLQRMAESSHERRNTQ